MRLRHGRARGAGADAERTVGGGTVGHALLLGLRDIKGKTGDSRVVTLFESRSVILLSPSPRARPGVPLSPPFSGTPDQVRSDDAGRRAPPCSLRESRYATLACSRTPRAGKGAPYHDSDPRPRIELRRNRGRSEEHTSELQSLMRISYAVFCLK